MRIHPMSEILAQTGFKWRTNHRTARHLGCAFGKANSSGEFAVPLMRSTAGRKLSVAGNTSDASPHADKPWPSGGRTIQIGSRTILGGRADRGPNLTQSSTKPRDKKIWGGRLASELSLQLHRCPQP